MKLEWFKKEVIEILKESSAETAQEILDAWKAELLTMHLCKELKREFSAIPRLVELASKITIHTYNWMRVDYRVMEKCKFSINYNHQIVSFAWENYYEKGGEIDSYSLFYSENTKLDDWKLLQECNVDGQIEIELAHWRKVARRLNVLDVLVYNFVKFIGNICSIAQRSIITLDDKVLWHGSEGAKNWLELDPFQDSTDRMPDGIYFVICITEDIPVAGDDKKSVRLEVSNEKNINAIEAAIENETDIVVIQQHGIGEEPLVGAAGFIAVIVKERLERNGIYNIRVKSKQKVIVKELLRSSSCIAAKVETKNEK